MKTIHFSFPLIAMLLLHCSSFAQERDDYGSWTDIQINKSWTDASGAGGPYVGLRGEFRSKENFSATDIWFVRPTVGYRFNDWLKSDISYDWCRSDSKHQHKFLFSVTGTLKSGGISVSVREMFVRVLSVETGAPEGAGTGVWSNLLRSRLNAHYTIPECRIRPYLAVELFTWARWINTRHYVGAVLPLGRHCSADLFYLYLTTAGSASARHIAGLGINIDL